MKRMDVVHENKIRRQVRTEKEREREMDREGEQMDFDARMELQNIKSIRDSDFVCMFLLLCVLIKMFVRVSLVNCQFTSHFFLHFSIIILLLLLLLFWLNLLDGVCKSFSTKEKYLHFSIVIISCMFVDVCFCGGGRIIADDARQKKRFIYKMNWTCRIYVIRIRFYSHFLFYIFLKFANRKFVHRIKSMI